MTKYANILGVKYKIRLDVPRNSDKELESNYGYCAFLNKEIVLGDLNTYNCFEDETEEAKLNQINETLRHEVLHAFLYESGLNGSSLSPDCWARNEEMVDWFAIQSPKIYAVYKQLGCI